MCGRIAREAISGMSTFIDYAAEKAARMAALPDSALRRHGFSNLSPSACNSFSADAALWFLERVKRVSWTENVLATRGKAIESGVAYGLLNPDVSRKECGERALVEFDAKYPLLVLGMDAPDKDRIAKQRAMVAPTVEVVLEELRQYGVPDILQERSEVWLPGVPVPFICYSDFAWSEHQIVMDLKTADKVPGKISVAHARAGGLYVHNSNRQMRFAYASPKRVEVYVLDSPGEHVEALRQIGIRMERFLSISDDPDFLLGLLCPNFDDYRWANPATRALGREVFGY